MKEFSVTLKQKKNFFLKIFLGCKFSSNLLRAWYDFIEKREKFFLMISFVPLFFTCWSDADMNCIEQETWWWGMKTERKGATKSVKIPSLVFFLWLFKWNVYFSSHSILLKPFIYMSIPFYNIVIRFCFSFHLWNIIKKSKLWFIVMRYVFDAVDGECVEYLLDIFTPLLSS